MRWDSKAKVVLGAKKKLAELAQQFDAYSNQITMWEAQIVDDTAKVFGAEGVLSESSYRP